MQKIIEEKPGFATRDFKELRVFYHNDSALKHSKGTKKTLWKVLLRMSDDILMMSQKMKLMS